MIPFGSRVATSRINFRLLAREAMANGKRLDIVAPDASARALAASAGIPVFGSVGEYEAALDAPPVSEGRAAGVTAAGTALGLAAGAAAGAVVAGGVAGGAAGAPAPAGATGQPSDTEPVRSPGGSHPTAATALPALDPADEAARDAELDAIVRRSREVPVAKAARRRRGPGAGLVLGILVLAGALVAAGVAAYLFLPTADITVTPQVEAVGPIDLTITADPAATAVDEAAGVIPAQLVEVPVSVSGEFPATGKRIETTPASGGVRWRNCDNSSAYTIPRGTTVRTASGIAFTTDEQLFLPVAVISGSGASVTLRCQSSEVAITAVDEGPKGNVDAGTIRVIPARYNRNLLSVNNPDATTGGTETTFTRVSRRDVEAAVATLGEQLPAEFEAQLEDPDGVPEGATVFPGTAVLGEAVPDPDPATLVNDEVETFTLSLSATGTVLAVDASPVEAIAAAALADAVSPGYELVEDSTQVVVGEGTVLDGVVVFPVAGAAKQLRPVDGEALRLEVMGLPEAEALALLEPFGSVELVLWPDFVTAVPTLDQRVTLAVGEPVDETPDAPLVPGTPGPAATPSGSPEDEVPTEPLPSG